MLRKTLVLAGLVLSALAFILDGTATNAEACWGCRRGCDYGGCGGGYGGGYYSSSYYGGGCGGGCCARRSCCATPAYTCCTSTYVAPACCGTYIYPGTNAYAPAYASYGVRPYYVGPAAPASTHGMPVVVPQGYGVTYRPTLVSYSR